MIEEWRPSALKDVEVSSFGRLRDMHSKELLELTHDYRGHTSCYFVCRGKLVHRLVALAFIDNPNEYKEVNHIDCNPLNNRVDNLEWCTHRQNEAWKYAGPNAEKNKQSQRQRALGNKATTGLHWQKTEEQRAAQSARMKGTFNSNNRLGTHHSEETKQKIRAAAIKRYQNPEERRKQSERSKVSNARQDVKLKQSIARKEYYKRKRESYLNSPDDLRGL